MIEKAEEILLGTILCIPEYQDQIISELNVNLFTLDNNKLVFKCISKLYANGTKIDLLTVVHAMSKSELEKIGGVYYVSNLTSKVSTGLHYDEQIRIIKENYIRTGLVSLFSREITKLTERSHDIQDTNVNVSAVMEELFNIPDNNMNHIYEVISKRLETYSTVEDGKLLGIETGHSKLNKITNGWQSGDLIILAARPSMGKTAISLLFSKYPALDGKKVLYFSLEMPKERLADRIISLETNINSQNLQSGRIESYEWEQLDIKTSKYKKSNLLINDESGLTVEGIRAASLKEVSKDGVDLIIIDYLQLITHSGGGGTTNDKVGHISKNLKGLAKKCECPVIALGQLNRAVENRPDKRPGLADLRDSGNIEQDADVVLFLYRPEYYGILEDHEGTSTVNLIEIYAAKNRNGALGSTSYYKNENWSYIGELPYEEMQSFNMPYNSNAGMEISQDPFGND